MDFAPVRIATISDEKNLFDLLMRLHMDNPNPCGLDVSNEKIWKHVNSACRGEGGIAGVISSGDDLVASIGIFPVNSWWTDAWVLSQHWLYVEPNYRTGGKYYKALLDFADWHRQDMSARLGCNMPLENSFLTTYDVKPRARLWRKSGRLIGMTYWNDGR